MSRLRLPRAAALPGARHALALLLPLLAAPPLAGAADPSLLRPAPASVAPAEDGGPPGSLAWQRAEARQRDAETLAALTADAQVLLARDRVRLNGYDYCSIAVAAAERGDLRTSIEAASRALLLGQQQNDADLAAVATRDLAIAYSYAGDLERAQDYARQALASQPQDASKVHAPAHKVLGDVALRRDETAAALAAYEAALQTAGPNYRPLVLVSMANAYLAQGEPARAREALRAAGPPHEAAQQAIHRRIEGRLLLAEGRHERAAAAFEAARDAAAAGTGEGSYERMWANDGLGQARLAQGRPAEARAAWLAALDDSETMRARFRSEEFKTGLFSDVQDIFERAIALAVEAGDFEQAWELSERSRARALLDVVRERVPGEPDRDRIGGTPVSLAELRAGLRPGEALVEYHSLDRSLVAWVIRPEGMQGFQLPLPRDDLALAVEDLRDAIVKRRRAAVDYARKLDELLVAPLGLRPDETLVIVPHGALHYLPFQALRSDAGYLVERHTLAVAPSAAIAAHLGQARGPAGSSLVAFGNPDIAPDYALPAAEREVNRIAPLFQRQQAFLRGDADRARFTRHAHQARILHVATHAEADTIDPLHSRILLAPVRPGTATDAPDLLLAREIYQLDLSDVALVTLSACETGLGRIARGDEILGFTRSFFYAGASTLVASLWPVSDDASELLMTTFYRGLTSGATAAQAMRAAQLAVLETTGYSHPFFWAPFNLMGDWRLTVQPDQA